MPVYASGLNPTEPEILAARMRAQGYRAFKLKIGFGRARDLANMKALRHVIGELPLMVDANQAWDLDTARELAPALEEHRPVWLDEPLRVDRPWTEWQQLAAGTSIGFAAGENIAGFAAFDAALESHALRVVQPDLAKWGGFSGCLPVARRILSHGLRFCPHVLGAGIGLLASAHFLAAVGGDGVLEVDANPNPLRSLTCGALARVTDGKVTLTEEAGLGVPPDLTALREFSIALG